MVEDFNPKILREAWARRWLQHMLKADHGRITETAKARYALIQVEMYAEAYLIGLATEVAPALDRFLAWTDQPEPERALYIAGDTNEDAWWLGLWQWRLAQGVALWLRGMSSRIELAAAAASSLEGMERTRFQKDADAARSHRRHDMGLHLLSMLTADLPASGRRLLEIAEISPPDTQNNRGTAFGMWACNYLAQGHSRDDAFLSGCERMLGEGLMSELLAHSAYLQSVLCLKAIYYDSGIVKTADQAISKVREWLPAVREVERRRD